MALLTDGYQATIDILGARLCIVKYTPPSVDFGEKKDMTCMGNEFWRTFLPRRLATFGDVMVVCNWDSSIYDFTDPIFGENTLVTFTFPDGAILTFWGWINKFEPAEMEEGKKPEATVTICASMMDNECNEQDLTITEGTAMCL